MTLLESLRPGARIAVVRIRSMGDAVLTTPGLELLHECRPDLEVAMVIENRFNAVFSGNPAVSHLLEPTPLAVRRFRPQLCLNLHGGTRSQWITGFSGARWRAGFVHHNTTIAYNFKIPRAQAVMGVKRRVHTAEHMASAFFALGVPLQEVPRASLFAGLTPLSGRYAVLHPYASNPAKQWPFERFSELARYLTLCNIQPVFLAGPQDSTQPFKDHQVVQSGLEETKAIVSGASLFVGNDSGPAHIAAAFGVPTAVLFSTSDPTVWEPWQAPSEVIVGRDGIETINVSRVIAAVERLHTLREAHA